MHRSHRHEPDERRAAWSWADVLDGKQIRSGWRLVTGLAAGRSSRPSAARRLPGRSECWSGDRGSQLRVGSAAGVEQPNRMQTLTQTRTIAAASHDAELLHVARHLQQQQYVTTWCSRSTTTPSPRSPARRGCRLDVADGESVTAPGGPYNNGASAPMKLDRHDQREPTRRTPNWTNIFVDFVNLGTGTIPPA